MFKQFNRSILKGLNIMEAKLDGLLRMRSDSYINIKRAGNGTTLSLNIQKLKGVLGKGGGTGGGANKAYVKTAPGAVTTVTCFLGEDTTGTEITVNCSVIGGSGSEKLNEAVPRMVDGSLIFVQQFGVDYWCISPFIATDDCECVQSNAVLNSLTISEDEKITFDGVGGDTFIRKNSVAGELETTVDAVTVTETKGD